MELLIAFVAGVWVAFKVAEPETLEDRARRETKGVWKKCRG